MSEVNNGEAQSTDGGESIAGQNADTEPSINEQQGAGPEADGSGNVAEPARSDVTTEIADEPSTTLKAGQLVERSDGAAYGNGQRVQGVVLRVDDEGAPHVGWFSDVTVESEDRVNIIA